MRGVCRKRSAFLSLPLPENTKKLLMIHLVISIEKRNFAAYATE